MCGIAGSYGRRDGVRVIEGRLHAALARMRYRGPDHTGVFAEPRCALGNLRLSIQDLRPSGNQPMYNEDRSVVVVFNGEIYNYSELVPDLRRKGHVFSSRSDTEVLVHLYEEYETDFATALNGMFAFALYDRRVHQLILGRDRSGQKPLFISESDGVLHFASEMASIMELSATRTLDPASISDFLTLGFVPEPRTILDGVRTLEGGVVEVFRGAESARTTFWLPQYRPQEVFSTLGEWLEIAKPTFRQAVRRHLVGDVPVTLFLSGGIDSGIVGCLATEEGKLSDAYVGSFSDERAFDEFESAANTARLLGLRPISVDLSRAELASAVPDYLDSMSQPLGDTSGIASWVLSRAVSREYKVVLGGDGGDELFGGYPTYLLPGLQMRYGFLPGWVFEAARRVSSRWLGLDGYFGLAYRLQQVGQAWGRPTEEAHFHVKSYLPADARSGILPTEAADHAGYGPALYRDLYEQVEGADPIQRLGWIDFRTFMQSCTIPKVDRTSMYFSLEARLPFLDNEVVDLSWRTPGDLRVARGVLKAPLKAMLKDLLPTGARIATKKRGFSPPIRAMLETELLEWKYDVLHTTHSVFNSHAVPTLARLRERGLDVHRLEWNMCVLQHWWAVRGRS